MMMERFALAVLMAVSFGGTAHAASAVNRDGEPRTLMVTEGGSKSEVVIASGETVQFCPAGCFVTMPNGDRVVLSGSETVEISGGQGRVR